MPRTTVNIDASVLNELKRRARRERKSVGRLISEITGATLKNQDDARTSTDFSWTAHALGARVDLEDKEALHRKLDES